MRALRPSSRRRHHARRLSRRSDEGRGWRTVSTISAVPSDRRPRQRIWQPARSSDRGDRRRCCGYVETMNLADDPLSARGPHRNARAGLVRPASAANRNSDRDARADNLRSHLPRRRYEKRTVASSVAVSDKYIRAIHVDRRTSCPDAGRLPSAAVMFLRGWNVSNY